jgi:hypothetical protein
MLKGLKNKKRLPGKLLFVFMKVFKRLTTVSN